MLELGVRQEEMVEVICRHCCLKVYMADSSEALRSKVSANPLNGLFPIDLNTQSRAYLTSARLYPLGLGVVLDLHSLCRGLVI
jgi:hypothetical protein